MFKAGIVVVVFAAVVLFSGNFLAAADKNAQPTDETMCIPMGTITLKPPEGATVKRTPVEFPHSTHFNFTCRTCHHKWTATEKVKSCMTAGCHSLAKLPPAGSQKAAAATIRTRYYKNAFHGLCIKCHKKIRAKNQLLAASTQLLEEKPSPVGPTGCVKCHPKGE